MYTGFFIQILLNRYFQKNKLWVTKHMNSIQPFITTTPNITNQDFMKTKLFTYNFFTLLALTLFTICASNNCASAQVSLAATAGTTGPVTYSNLSTALAAIDSGTHQGDIVIDISASFTDPNIAVLNSSGSGSALYTSVLIRPSNDGIIVSCVTPQGRGIIELNGSDSVTINGDNPNSAGTNRNLTFTNAAANTVTFTSAIRIATSAAAPFSDANSITIKNININGSASGRNITGATSTSGSENTTFGIVSGPNGGAIVTALASVSTGMATGAVVNNLMVTNCTINQSARAIAFIGGSITSSSNISITNNIIGDQSSILSGALPYTSPSTTVYTKGIIVQGAGALTISNNIIKNMISYVATPMSAIELTANIGSGTINITNNQIEGIVQNTSTANGTRGIWVANAAGAYTIGGNTIQNLQCNAPSSTQQPAGIQVVTAAPSAIIENNKISKVYNWNNQSYGVNGIIATGGSNITFQNNMISDIRQDMSTSGSFGTTYSIYGIKITTGTGHKIYHNTVHLSGTSLGAGAPATNQSSFAFCITSTAVTGADVRNNIFSNSMIGVNTGTAHTAIFLPSGGTSAMNLILNNNAYFTGGNDTIQGIAQVGGTAGTGFYKTLAFNSSLTTPTTNLRFYTKNLLSAGTNDSLSMAFNTAAPFVSSTDLHILAGTLTPLESTGASVGLITDMDGNARPGPAGSINGGAFAADLGADEGDFIPVNLVVDSATVDQIISATLPGTLNLSVIRVKVYLSGFVNPPTLSSLKLHTTGSTSNADISAAHIYYTGPNSTFNTSNTFGASIPSPGNTFYATGSQTLSKGINYFWLTYDVSSGAGVGNVLDATLDSLRISGVNYAPVNGNPGGNITITNPMVYLSSTTTQANTSKIGQGAVHNQIIGVQVLTSATGTPINLSQLDFNTNGTTDTANIRNIKVWYTGTNSAFNTSSQFGTTLNTLPGSTNFSITGSQALSNGTNYFWLTYDINPLATVGNVVDAECTSVTIEGIPQLPTITAPAGSRQIRVEYCPPVYTYSCSNGDFVNHFSTTNAVNNISFLSTGCNNTSNSYNYYQSQTIVAKKGSTISLHYQGSGVYNEGLKIWIDYNQDGMFDATEMVASAPSSLIMNHSNITIPCNATTGITRLRIRDVYNALPGTACGTELYGEAEDYDINVLDNPVYYEYSTAIQQTGAVAPGTNDQPILRIPVKASGCGAILSTDFKLNTAGTTNAGTNLLAAKLYSTGNSPLFNTSKLIATVFSPNGQFSFPVSDTLINNDTTNYWLAYDVQSSALVGNTIDARLDSIQVGGNFFIPAQGNPAGNIQILLPMTYVSSTVTQPSITKVAMGSANNPIIRVELSMSTGAPVNITQLDFNSNGTTDTSNIRNIKVWYSGNANTFSTATQFGTTLNTLPGSTTFSITGNQALSSGTNYFWLTYDINATSALGNMVDGECVSILVNGNLQFNTVSAPVGARQIRNPYCVPTQTGTALIKNVSLNTLNYTSFNATTPFYRVIIADTATTTIASSVTYNLSVTTTTNASVSVWIDYNNDGLFGATEWKQVTANGVPNIATIVPITIPCGYPADIIRMRVRTRTAAAANGATDACTAFAGGETQDFTISFISTPVSHGFNTARQQTGNVAPGTNDNPVLRVPVKVNGCGLALATALHFNTIGSTNNADIVAAKLYSTGHDTVFNTLKQIGSTVFSPSGSFNFTFSDTLLNNDTTNYWLTYDVNPGSIYGHALDARLDSLQMNATYYTPILSNPAGSLTISGPMLYLNSTTIQSPTVKIGQGTTHNQIIGIEVNTSATGSAVNMTQFDFSALGTTDTANIRNLKVWYTGANPLFNTSTQFGATMPYLLSGTTSFTIMGAQPMVNGSNHFWLSYDISATATIGNIVDASCTSFNLDGTPYTPAITAPSGNQIIRANYCVPPFTTGCGDGDFVNNFLTIGGVTNISNLVSGCNPNTDSYIYYPSQVLTIRKGAMFSLTYRGSGDWPEGHKVWLDFNQDGVFDSTEQVASSAPSTLSITTQIAIPLSALEGSTRIRIRNVYNAQPTSSCSSQTWGETEDYNVYILPAPAPVSYTWNKTLPDSFNLSQNWTPARTSPNMNDILRFDAGGSVTIHNILNQSASQVIIANNTIVTMNAPSQSMLNISDSLKLLSGKMITGPNMTLSVGSDSMNTGVITGTGSIEGVLRRWINNTTSSYSLPLVVGANNRNMVLNYTTAPSSGGTITAKFVQTPLTSGGLPLTQGAITITKVSNTGSWVLTSGDGLTGGAYTVTVTAQGFAGVTNYSGLVLLNRTSNVLPWSLLGTHVTTTGSNTIPVLSRTGISTYNEFAVGGDSTINPLPVSLLSFTAKEQSGNVALNWSTSSEINNSGFTIERKYEKTPDWSDIGFVQSKGNSSTLTHYSFIDIAPFTSTLPVYYRLKQMDRDGRLTYSPVVSVSPIASHHIAVTGYPNPFTNKLTLSLQMNNDDVLQLEMTDINGSMVLKQQIMANKGLTQYEISSLEGIKPGMYILKIYSDRLILNTLKLTKTE